MEKTEFALTFFAGVVFLAPFVLALSRVLR